MINKLYLLFISACLGTSLYAQDIWVQKDSMNGPGRANAAGFVLLDDGYVATGYDGFDKKRSMVSYDISQDDWDDELQMGGASGDGLNRTSAIGFQAYGFGFVGLGEGTSFMFNDLWMYDRYTDTWTQMANFPGGARTQAVSFEIDNIAYVGTGKADDFSTLLNDFWKYDYMANSWTQVADFPGTARLDAVGCRMGGKGYVGLGYDGSAMQTDFYEYYPVDDTWAQKASFPGAARINAVSFARFPQLFVTTGDDGFNYLNDTWEYNYFGDVWSQTTDFPAAGRSGAIAFVIENRCYVGGGTASGNYYDDFYEFVFILGEEQIDLDLSTVYPNPNNGTFTVSLPQLTNLPLMKLYDASGKEVSISYQQSGSQMAVEIDNAALNIGQYYLVIFEHEEVIAKHQISVRA